MADDVAGEKGTAHFASTGGSQPTVASCTCAAADQQKEPTTSVPATGVSLSRLNVSKVMSRNPREADSGGACNTGFS